MNDRDDEIRNECRNLTDALGDFLEGHSIDAIIPALAFTLGTVLAETGQDKVGSIKFVINSIIKIYEAVDEDEEDESC